MEAELRSNHSMIGRKRIRLFAQSPAPRGLIRLNPNDMSPEETLNLEPRVAVLEVQVQDVKADMGEIKDGLKRLSDNHLPHLNARLDSMKTGLIGVLVSVIMTLIGTITLIFK